MRPTNGHVGIRSYLGCVKRALREDAYIVRNAKVISSVSCADADLFELALSKLLLERPELTLLQIGANTGKGKHDLFDHITKFKIRSVLVEPQPDVFKMLRDNYADLPHVACENVALAREEGGRKIYRLSELADQFDAQQRGFGTGIASFSREHVWDYFVNHCTPEGLRQDQDKIVVAFDVLVVDTEGFDFEILKMVQIDDHRPSLVKFEHRHLSRHDRRAAWEHLRVRGFQQFVMKASGDTVATRF